MGTDMCLTGPMARRFAPKYENLLVKHRKSYMRNPEQWRISEGLIFSDTKQVSYLELDAVYNANFFICRYTQEARGIGDIHEIIVFDTILTDSAPNGYPVLLI